MTQTDEDFNRQMTIAREVMDEHKVAQSVLAQGENSPYWTDDLAAEIETAKVRQLPIGLLVDVFNHPWLGGRRRITFWLQLTCRLSDNQHRLPDGRQLNAIYLRWRRPNFWAFPPSFACRFGLW